MQNYEFTKRYIRAEIVDGADVISFPIENLTLEQLETLICVLNLNGYECLRCDFRRFNVTFYDNMGQTAPAPEVAVREQSFICR